MTLSVILSRAVCGIRAPQVHVETHLAGGLPSFNMVGLPETTVKEAKDRVRSALQNCRFDFPQRRITVNLAPADLPKEGGRFDLPIAVGLLHASGQLGQLALDDFEFVGELALSGEIRAVTGILPHAIAAARTGKVLVLPKDNEDEVSYVPNLKYIASDHLLAITAHLKSHPHSFQTSATQTTLLSTTTSTLDLKDVVGQALGKRALTIAAAGGHHLLFVGPPGTGKTMLAARLPSILPPMNMDEALEAATIASIAGLSSGYRFGERPFRAPHHTASAVALVGGGSRPRPGEISLAHQGILFLDELPEFDRRVLEVLREPLESGHVVISRAAQQETFPANFQLIAAMNPCPCGYFGTQIKPCRCQPGQVRRYLGKLSGPLLDRIDLHVEIPPLPRGTLTRAQSASGPSSSEVREQVIQARNRQFARQGCLNAALAGNEFKRHVQLSETCGLFLENAMTKLKLSTRAFYRIVRVARTIADLEGAPDIATEHLAEALQYRQFDRLQTRLQEMIGLAAG